MLKNIKESRPEVVNGVGRGKSCDKLPDGCTNCKKGGHECKGYRDALDLRFRDETKFVAQKAKDKIAQKKRQARAKASSNLNSGTLSSSSSDSSGSPDSSANDLFSNAVEVLQKSSRVRPIAKLTGENIYILSDNDLFLSSPTGSPSRSLSPSLDDQAIGFFFTHHVINPASSLDGMDECFKATIKAIGLAGIASLCRTSYLKVEARKGYQKAIHEVNQALILPSTATNDSTLMAIMLLGQFETVETSPQSLAAWENHINGAAAVLKLRGPERLKQPLQIRLFVQVISSLIVNSMRGDVLLPPYIFELIEVAAQHSRKNDTTWRFFYLQVMVYQFRAEAKQNILNDPFSILENAIRLDGLCLEFFNTVKEPIWKFDTIYTNAYPDLVLFGHYHVYQAYLSSQIWSGLRSLRIGLNEAIRRILLRGFSCNPPLFSGLEYAAQFQTSTDTLFQLQIDAIASIPQMLGLGFGSTEQVPPGTLFLDNENIFVPQFPWSQFPRAYMYDPKHSMHTTALLPMTGKTPLLRGFGGYLLPWLLYMGGNISVSSPEIQQAILKILRWVARAMDIKQASVLADELEETISKRAAAVRP